MEKYGVRNGIINAIVAATNSVHALKGMLRKPLSPVSIEDMNLAIAKQGAKGR